MKSMCEDFPCPLLQEDLKLLFMWVLEASREAHCSPTFDVDLTTAFCITIHNVTLLKTKLNDASLMKISIIKKGYFILQNQKSRAETAHLFDSDVYDADVFIWLVCFGVDF